MSAAEDPAGQSAETRAPSSREGVALQTALIHHRYAAPAGFGSPVEPVHKGSTVYFPSVAALRSQQWLDKSGYTYGLHGTPTTFTLEARLATLEGARHVLLAPQWPVGHHGRQHGLPEDGRRGLAARQRLRPEQGVRTP